MEPGCSPPSAPPPPPPPPPSKKIPTLLNRYQLGPLLGRGSFAKVHKAKSIADGSIVAIKTIEKNNKFLDAAMEDRIVREVSAMRRLQNHPNVLKIQEVMATKTKIYLVMEYAAGGELFGKLRRGRLTESAARRYFQQLVSALHFCHQNGVAHRDVKPQNLLLDRDGNLKVSDFGLSALPEQIKNGMLHTACGTPAYTAPEVVARRGYDGAVADAWSCGVILFVLLAGYLPFDDSNLLAMYKKVNRRDYQFPSFVSKPARSLIYQLLDPNPKTRMSIEKIMSISWFQKSLQQQRKRGQESSLFELGVVGNNKYILKEKIPDIVSMNAFDIISLSSGLDLSGLFEAKKRKEKRFTTKEKTERVVEKVKEVGERLGYVVEKGKGDVVGLGKLGKMVLLVEVLMEIAPETFVVGVKVVDNSVCGRVALEFDEGDWNELQAGLGDIVLSWHTSDVM
ncbi:CBL-interacting serine/threonine-protein kinase 4 [Citrus sinensis]|uniref:non-specific serine/threonine protein kinase n=1 Tax=Citrus sinensis TaxID=2711 RepID=A0A067EJ57_CITSI|nr:CBL-interacting serine/threonine-protein kinase 4-like [Citrus sinensis]KAH9764699.1 CBL-interacting serine/threonine-protein kinase 4 [Citrus sinensis]KDO53940.1 hypothetical protein CISIN_1g013005mg [Citrus sinensis]